MARKFFIHLLILLTTQVSNGEMGFYSPESFGVPAKVKQGAQAVFRVGFAQGPATIEKLSEVSIPEMNDNNYWRVLQLQLCKLQKLNNCPILAHEYTGTAFLFRDKHTIATNLHNVQDWIYHAITNNPPRSPESIIPPFFLVDGEGEFIYHPLEDGKLRLSFYNKSTNLFKAPMWGALDDMQLRISDYVELTFDKEFSQSPILEGSTPSLTQQMYMISFPHGTTHYEAGGFNDSDGFQKYLSRGYRLPGNINETIPWLYDMAGGPGSSGGPLLDVSGQASALIFAGTSEWMDGEIQQEASFIPLNKQLLTDIWQRAAHSLSSVVVDDE